MTDKKEQYGFNDHWYRGHHILPVLGDSRREGDRWYVQAWFDDHTCYAQEHSASRKFRTLADAKEHIDMGIRHADRQEVSNA